MDFRKSATFNADRWEWDTAEKRRQILSYCNWWGNLCSAPLARVSCWKVLHNFWALVSILLIPRCAPRRFQFWPGFRLPLHISTFACYTRWFQYFQTASGNLETKDCFGTFLNRLKRSTDFSEPVQSLKVVCQGPGSKSSQSSDGKNFSGFTQRASARKYM